MQHLQAHCNISISYIAYTARAPFLRCLQHMVPTVAVTISTPKMAAMTARMMAKTKTKS